MAAELSAMMEIRAIGSSNDSLASRAKHAKPASMVWSKTC